MSILSQDPIKEIPLSKPFYFTLKTSAGGYCGNTLIDKIEKLTFPPGASIQLILDMIRPVLIDDVTYYKNLWYGGDCRDTDYFDEFPPEYVVKKEVFGPSYMIGCKVNGIWWVLIEMHNKI